jgi:methionyl-tRNA formyltransferase
MTAQNKGLKIVFMGSPDFACPTLQALLDSTHEILHVLTQPPRAAGRGMAMKKTPVAELAEANHIPVSWPISLKSEEEAMRLAALDADLFIVVAYGLILPKQILDIPRLGCVNGHASLLPRWRGAAPIQRAIEAGDRKTGTCAMMMEEGLDTGAVLLRKSTPITGDDTAQSLHDRLAMMTAQTLSQALPLLADGSAAPIAQSEEGVTYAAKIQKTEAALSFDDDAQKLKQQIHAFSPFPGAFITGDSTKRLKCLSAVVTSCDRVAEAGTFLGHNGDDGIIIACGNGTYLGIKTLQPAGKKPMSADEFLRGRTLDVLQSFTAQI